MLIAQRIANRDDVLCLNIFACYGYGEKPNRFPSYAICTVLENKTIEINQNVVFDYLFVEDMQKIIEHFIVNKPKKHNIINITPSKSISLEDIAKLVLKISNSNQNITIKNLEVNNPYTGDNSRLLEEIPDFDFTDMETGLTKLYRYIKENTIVKI